MRFEWDESKDASNSRKHGVEFEIAARVFRDPLARRRQDRTENGEERWQILGETPGGNLLLVAYTIRLTSDEEVIRIISARKATRHERSAYESASKS